MKNKKLFIYSILKHLICFFVILIIYSCSSKDEIITQNSTDEISETTLINPLAPYANISFNNLKVTLPVDENNNGSPDEYSAAQLSNFGYRTLAPVIPFMYDDTTDESIVFYTYPASSTANSNYSRTELREMMNPTNSKINWTLNQGGTFEGRLKLVSVTQDNISSSYDYHRVIMMQIHGIISQADMLTHGFLSNNGPPLLKIYWIDGHIKAYKKTLVNSNTTGDALLDVSSSTWTDISHDFGYIGYDPFDLKVIASTGKLEVTVNNSMKVFEDISLAKWPFENYFKAGNYLITTEPTANSTVKYYKLNINH